MFADVMAIVAVAAPYILQAEADKGSGNGPAKEDQVVAAIDAEIEKEGGLDFPKWMPAIIRPVVVRGCIKFTVFLFNRAGGAELVKKLLGSSTALSSSL